MILQHTATTAEDLPSNAMYGDTIGLNVEMRTHDTGVIKQRTRDTADHNLLVEGAHGTETVSAGELAANAQRLPRILCGAGLQPVTKAGTELEVISSKKDGNESEIHLGEVGRRVS